MPRNKLIGKSTKLSDASAGDEISSADISQNADGAMRNIGVDLIRCNPRQPRQHFDPEKMAELTESVRESGVLQPVIVRFEGQEVHLVAGERRLRAARAAGLKKIPAIITEGDPVHIALIENIQREDLNPLEEAEAIMRLMEDRGYTQEQVARIVGKAKSTISEILSLNRLPEAIRKDIPGRDHYPKRVLVQIAKQKTPDKMLALFEKIRAQNLSSDAVREIVKKNRGKGGKPAPRDSAKVVSKKASELASRISRLSLSEMGSQERDVLLKTLEELKEAISRCTDRIRQA